MLLIILICRIDNKLYRFWCKGTTFCLIFHNITYFLMLDFLFSYYFA